MNASPRRWLFPVVLALAALLALSAIGIALYGADPVRVVALLQKVLRRDFGLALAYEGEPRLTFWPQPGVALDGYRIDVVATSQPLAWGRSLAVEVPWRAFRAEQLELERIELDGPVFNARALATWQWPGAAATPRWPRVTSGIVVRDAKWIGAGVPARVVGGLSFEVTPIAPGRRLHVDAAWSRDAEGPPLEMKLDAMPRDAPDGLALEAIELELREGESAAARFAGDARFASTRDWSLRGTLDADRLPGTIAAHFAPRGAAHPPPSKLRLELVASRGKWRVVTEGSLAGSTLDADLTFDAFPDLSSPLPTLLEAVRRDVHGHARIARLRFGDVELEGIELGDAPAVPAAPPSTSQSEMACAGKSCRALLPSPPGRGAGGEGPARSAEHTRKKTND